MNENQDLFDISNEEIKTTLENPDRIERHSTALIIYLKKFNRGRRNYLMVGTGEVNKNIGVLYWIPEELIAPVPLLSILEVFANRFGVRLRIGKSEGYFLLDVIKLGQGELPLSPPFFFSFANEYHNVDISIAASIRKINQSGTLSTHNISYCFAINRFKYLSWLNPVPKTQINVPSHLFQSMKEFIDCLNPNGSSKITILKNKISNSDTPAPASDELVLQIPSVYKRPFDYFNKIFKERAVDDSVRVIVDNHRRNCYVCNNTELSKEHIFPKWHREFFPNKQLRMGHAVVTVGTEPSSVDNSRLDEKVEDTYGVTVDRICVECNGTWLSQLEESSKQIFVDNNNKFIKDIDSLGLDDRSKFTLSRWIAVKAILLSLKYHYPLESNLGFLRLLKEEKIPDGFVVEISEEITSDVAYVLQLGLEDERINLTGNYNYQTAREHAKGFFCAVVQFGNFLFRVTYLRSDVGLSGRVIQGGRTSVLYPRDYLTRYLDMQDDRWQTVPHEFRLTHFLRSIAISNE
jgi:hypothetical protein